MNRRGFFKLLAAAVAAPVVAPLVKLLPKDAASTLGSNASYNVRYTFGPAPVELRRYYNKELISVLKAETPFTTLGRNKQLPFNGGKNIQFVQFKLGKE